MKNKDQLIEKIRKKIPNTKEYKLKTKEYLTEVQHKKENFRGYYLEVSWQTKLMVLGMNILQTFCV